MPSVHRRRTACTGPAAVSLPQEQIAGNEEATSHKEKRAAQTMHGPQIRQIEAIRDGQFSHDPEAVSMSNVDAEDLIVRFSGGLAPADRACSQLLRAHPTDLPKVGTSWYH